jgi:hypothetical protein
MAKMIPHDLFYFIFFVWHLLRSIHILHGRPNKWKLQCWLGAGAGRGQQKELPDLKCGRLDRCVLGDAEMAKPSMAAD